MVSSGTDWEAIRGPPTIDILLPSGYEACHRAGSRIARSRKAPVATETTRARARKSAMERVICQVAATTVTKASVANRAR